MNHAIRESLLNKLHPQGIFGKLSPLLNSNIKKVGENNLQVETRFEVLMPASIKTTVF
jgi:hypothetical protein